MQIRLISIKDHIYIFPSDLQIGYNLLWRSPEYDVLPICQENAVSLLAYSPLQQGLLSGRFSKHEDVPAGRKRGKLFSPDRYIFIRSTIIDFAVSHTHCTFLCPTSIHFHARLRWRNSR